MTVEIPGKINLGSGKSWRSDYLNIDIDARWDPDVIADFNEPIPPTNTTDYMTSRFGRIRLEGGKFDQIVAHDVLEHLHDLTTCMGSCLKLLKPEGTMDILVPYDLSHGAWQDPTHVRAFNERSWIYFTDWFWYLGWDEYRFSCDRLNLNLSPLGDDMQKKLVGIEEIARTPRAVDSMRVILRKVPLNDQDRAAMSKYLAIDNR